MSTTTQWAIRDYIPRHENWPYTAADFQRMDEFPDGEFYSNPRLCTHIDDQAIHTLSQYYDAVLPRKGRILDFCSSWVSHFPPDLEVAAKSGSLHVVGMGMSQVELDRNPVLSTRIVQDLNAEPAIPMTDPLDAATCVVSIDYLTQPVKVLESIRDRLVPGGQVHLVISNRCFPTKVVGRWLRVSESERLEMVGDYLHFAGYERIEVVTLTDGSGWRDPLWVVRGKRAES
ncbi:hypothetical protein BD324DRAFT_630731 [Kockovaella imperatae]|uniref:S-adenosyl-L-methionine-dependent methyltransferase n=1 Tax=Kockovaella imperatae TaxID=4999 RepID=A0A1Y1UC36_9TREE|nr:hypothetical protein BD324DRAFT_630731 [Kockovaella imperatae]ORX35579.1 hypothetical protein BD324DRAFT_630731 [Kockovaella imperatae]